tara:strand:+ start:512 stop:880 length:369 start_codon:yes stop_codon:yes gene_type:complete
MTSSTRTIDLLKTSFDLNQRRKFTLTKEDGSKLVDLYFKPITRSDRVRVTNMTKDKEGNADALRQSTTMLCQMAELEDGTKAFSMGDVASLQREIPEKVLNDMELFLFEVGGDVDLDEAKNE